MMNITGRVAHIETIYRIYDPSGVYVEVRPEARGIEVEISSGTESIHLPPIVARGVAEAIIKSADSLEDH